MKHELHHRAQERKIKETDKNKCPFSSSLFCSRRRSQVLPEPDAYTVGAAMTKAKTTMVREHEHRRTNEDGSGCNLTNTSTANSKKLVFFCYDDERTATFLLCLNRGDHYSRDDELSTGPYRTVVYHQGRVSKHISDVKIYGFRSFSSISLLSAPLIQ